MKQNITLQQWDELTHEEKNKLDDYGMKHDWQMSIGQMIWFLGKNWYRNLITNKVNKLTVTITILECELICDALWENVKYKLRK